MSSKYKDVRDYINQLSYAHANQRNYLRDARSLGYTSGKVKAWIGYPIGFVLGFGVAMLIASSILDFIFGR